MREQRARRQFKKLGPFARRFNRYGIPAMDRKYQRASASYLYVNDRDAWIGSSYFFGKKFYHSITITICSAGVTGYGIGQLVSEYVRG